jgi:hypothetical protein
MASSGDGICSMLVLVVDGLEVELYFLFYLPILDENA